MFQKMGVVRVGRWDGAGQCFCVESGGWCMGVEIVRLFSFFGFGFHF